MLQSGEIAHNRVIIITNKRHKHCSFVLWGPVPLQLNTSVVHVAGCSRFLREANKEHSHTEQTSLQCVCVCTLLLLRIFLVFEERFLAPCFVEFYCQLKKKKE